MKRLRAIRRWFTRRIGYARLLCLALLIGFAALRIADPAPVEEIRVRTFDFFQRIEPRKKTMKLDALAQAEAPFRLVGVIDLPFGRKPRHQFSGPVGDVHLPGDQRVVNRVGGELVGAGAAVGLAGSQRNVRHRYAVAHYRLSLC